MSCMAKKLPCYLVTRDTREQKRGNGWTFPASDRCEGTIIATMKTGDYTLVGYEHLFIIERKASTAEFATNLFEKRFERELYRMDKFEHPYLILEFTFEDVVKFPEGSGIPRSKWPDLRVTPQLMMARLHEMQLAHPQIRILLVGNRGREVASSLFKRIVEHYAS